MIKNAFTDFVSHLSAKGKLSLFFAVGVMIVFFGMQSLIVFGFLLPSFSLSLYGYACFIAFCPAFFQLLREYNEQFQQKLLEERQLQNLVVEFRESSTADLVPDIYNQACIISKTDAGGNLVYVNENFRNISGYSMDELMGSNHRIISSGLHSRDYWIEMYRTTLQEKKVWKGLITNRSRDGRLFYLETYIKANFDSVSGKHLGFTSVRFDFSPVKTREKAYLNRMNAINRSNLVVEFDVDGNIRFANDMFLELMEYSFEEIKGKHQSILVSPERADSYEYALLWLNLKEGKPMSSEFDCYTKSGRKVWLQATYSPINDMEGQVTRIMQIAIDATLRVSQSIEIDRKNSYLEQAAKIMRHDMHSGINVYIPRGVAALTKRIPQELVESHSLGAPIRMLREGMAHTQKVYRGVYEFTGLVKPGASLKVEDHFLQAILTSHISTTAYKENVKIEYLGTWFVNEHLFCTAIDNLIRNGLKYNDSLNKLVRIYREPGNILVIEDNGRGMTQEEFNHFSRTGTRREGQKESGSGLGLGICVGILREHKFTISCERLQTVGSAVRIKLSSRIDKES